MPRAAGERRRDSPSPARGATSCNEGEQKADDNGTDTEDLGHEAQESDAPAKSTWGAKKKR
jgi:hypothetical protein